MKLDKAWMDSINIRTSRRKYESGDIERSKIDNIEAMIESINEESGLRIKFVENASDILNGFAASYGMISGATSLIALIGDSYMQDLKKYIGYYGELLVLECTRLGLGTCWIGGTYNKKACKNSVNLSDNEEVVCIIAVGDVNDEKSFKEKLVSRLNRKNKSFDETLVSCDGEVLPWIKAGIDASILAPSAMNKQPIAFSFVDGKLKAFVIKENHGYEYVDLGIAMAHFQLGAFSCGHDGEWQVINGENIFM
ncbi:nitroreductase family protein [Clostridium sp. SHJSY1]|uniref:nitroreductase family protein n=1 Tax=Clostridium sp. SHJSY1 TaxID=2942483 RepID=UPI002873F55D|nr:nitroreductase family protein [Clostridium sp. SHJSY1]MDS0524367.1 nitroreductase family protein [Clostridium sp. SHJSY1]